MKIHLDIRDPNPSHTRLGLFIDSVYCGELTLATKDVVTFLMISRHGTSDTLDTYLETGAFDILEQDIVR